MISWNVENALRCLPALPTIVDELGRPEVLCLQELRIRGSDEQAISALTQALPGYRCHYSLPRDPRNVTFRGGRMYGVATFVQGHWRAEVPEWDLEGRVIVVRRDNLAIVNVYAVNGTAKPHFDRCRSHYRRPARAETPISVARDGSRSRTSKRRRGDHDRRLERLPEPLKTPTPA